MAEQKAKLDFASGQSPSNEQLGGAIPQSVNVLVDATGTIRLRPGISAWDDFGASPLLSASTTVDGISVWNGYVVYVTSDRLIHVQISPGYGVDLSDATAASQLDGPDRPVLCPTRTRIVIAGGGFLQKWEGPAHALSERLGGAPAATHVVAISHRLVVNPVGLSGQIQWSNPGDAANETWIGEFKDLESSPDPLPALYENTGELVGLGTETVQTLAADVAEIFISVRTWEMGCVAPYSFAKDEEKFGFLDSLKRIQLGNGRSYQAISDPFLSGTLRGLPRVDDCWGFRAPIAGWDVLGWHFPQAGRTFVWDDTRWTEFRGHENGQWTPWMAQSHFYWPDGGLNLIGLADGTIGKLDVNAVTDMGQPIVGEIYTGFDDHGIDNWKQHITTRFSFKRGIGDGSAPGPKCQLFWRDSTGAWEDPEELDLGDPDDPEPVIEVRSLGTYRTRQWRLRMSDSVPLTFVGAMVTFEVLEQ